MSANLSKLRLFLRHQRSLVGLGFGFTLLLTTISSHTILFPCVHERVVVGLVHTSRGSSYHQGPKAHVVCHIVHYPPPPRAHSFVIGLAVINNYNPSFVRSSGCTGTGSTMINNTRALRVNRGG